MIPRWIKRHRRMLQVVPNLVLLWLVGSLYFTTELPPPPKQKNWESPVLPEFERENQTCRLVAGVPRRRMYLAIGLPTVQRAEKEYLFETLSSLLSKSSKEEQETFTIIVMLADRSAAYNQDVLRRIRLFYPDQLKSGVIQVVLGPDTEFIFREEPSKLTFNDSVERVRWRSKQNLDYAALMEYSAKTARYYIQLEDDIQPVDRYFSDIQDFIDKNTRHDPSWARLEVYPRGFIGKVFKSAVLPKLAAVLRAYYLDMPSDYLMRQFYSHIRGYVLRHERMLFFHQGRHSSLTGVIRGVDKLV